MQHNRMHFGVILNRCIWTIWGVFLGYIFAGMLFLKKVIDMPATNETKGNNIVYFLVTFLSFFLMYVLVRRIWREKSEKKLRFKILGCTLLLYVVQLLIIKSIWFETGWDVTCVYYDAIHRAEEGTLLGAHDYFTMHPNNVFLTFIFALVDKVLYVTGIKRYYICLCCLGALQMNLSCLLVFYIVKKIANSMKAASVAWSVSAFFVALSPWMCVPYTDVYAILYPVAIWALYLSIPQNRWINAVRWMGIGLLTMIGYYIKPTASIMTMAVCIALVLQVIQCYASWKKNALRLLAILGGCLLGVGISQYGTHYMGLIPDEDRAFPMAHYFMLGQNDRTYGAFDGGDWNYVTSLNTKEEKIQKSMEEAFNRIQARGIAGNIRFYSIKNMVNYDNGAFSWGYEGDFYKDISSGTSGLSAVLKSILYSDGQYYGIYATIRQGIWLILIFGCLGVLWDKNRQYLLVPCMAIIGLTIFLLLFEARARYLFLYTPVYVILGCLGIRNIYNGLWEKLNEMLKHSDCA